MKKAWDKAEHNRISRKEKKMSRTTKCVFSLLMVMIVGVFFVNGDALGDVKIRGKIVGDPINIDPAHLKHAQDRIIAQQVFQGLLTFDVTTGPPHPVSPVLAESYEVSEDGKMITFKLHKGVQFHHGYGELTSEDVVFSLQRHLDPKVASRAGAQLGDVERIEAPDKYTVKIYLKIPSAITLLQNLAWQNAGFMLSKKAALKLGDKIQRMPIGTGPFYFDRWDPGEKVVLKKFDRYWRTPARIDEIVLWVIPEEIVALGALEKGDLDISEVSQLGAYDRAKTLKNIYLAQAKGNVWQYIYYINHKMKPMDDVRVRRALAYALDIKGICKRVGPLVVPFPSPLSPAVFAATDEFWRYEYDLDKARQLLAEAGYPKGFELRLLYNKNVLYEPIALEVKNCWDKIVDVKLELIERAVWAKTLRQFKHHIAAWGLARTAPYLYGERYETGSTAQYSQYSNPQVDEAIKKAKTARTEEEARKYWREFQRLATEDVVNLVVAVGGNVQAISNKVKGVLLYPYTGLIDLEKAYILK